MTGVDRTEVARSSGKAVWSPEASSLKVSVDVSVEVTVVAAASPGRGAQGHRQDKTRRRQGDGGGDNQPPQALESEHRLLPPPLETRHHDAPMPDVFELSDSCEKTRGRPYDRPARPSKKRSLAGSQNPKLLRPGWSSG